MTTTIFLAYFGVCVLLAFVGHLGTTIVTFGYDVHEGKLR